MKLDLRQLNYNKKQNKIKENIIDLLNFNCISVIVDQIKKDNIKYLDYSSINFLNHYLILRNLYIIRNDLLYFEVEKILKKICFMKFKTINEYYNYLKKIEIDNKLLIEKKFYNCYDSEIEYINYMINNNIRISKDQIKILNNYIDSLSIKEGV